VFQKFLVYSLFLVLVLFPKGGFKFGDIPVTWGYIYLLILGVASFPSHLTRFNKTGGFSLKYGAMLLMLPFVILVLGTYITYGFDSFGFGVSLMLNFSVIPYALLVLFADGVRRNINCLIGEALRLFIPLVVIYGILGFGYTAFTGQYAEVPYLTVNGGQVGELMNKHNNRGGLSKLVSTYNNGNIYGICMLLLAPLYFRFEKNGVFRALFRLSLALTLSRTAWIGWSIFELSNSLLGRWSPLGILKFLVIGVFVAGSVVKLSEVMEWDNSVLFDRELGGRAEKFDLIDSIGILPQKAFDPTSEIVYYQMLVDFGFIGLLIFLIAFMGPVFLIVFRKPRNPEKKEIWSSALLAVILYWIVCLSDGAILLVPVMVFYWFNVSVLYSMLESPGKDVFVNRKHD